MDHAHTDAGVRQLRADVGLFYDTLPDVDSGWWNGGALFAYQAFRAVQRWRVAHDGEGRYVLEAQRDGLAMVGALSPHAIDIVDTTARGQMIAEAMFQVASGLEHHHRKVKGRCDPRAADLELRRAMRRGRYQGGLH